MIGGGWGWIKHLYQALWVSAPSVHACGGSAACSAWVDSACLVLPLYEEWLGVMSLRNTGQCGRERVVKERPSRGRKYFHLQQRMHSFVFSAPPVLLFNWNLTRSILKNASIFPVCFYCMIPGVQSWSLHLQQLTLFTSSPWQTKSCWLPPCHLLQLCIQTLTQQWCWHCGFSRPFVTMSQGSQAVCFHFWLLQMLLRVKRSRSASSISASGALVEGLSAEDQESKQSLKEVLLPICKAELKLAKVSLLLAAWFSSSLVKGKEAELDYPKREAGRVN